MTERVEFLFQQLNNSYQVDDAIIKTDQFIKCRFCKQFNVTFISKQTRSADESATIFYTCHTAGCDKMWRT